MYLDGEIKSQERRAGGKRNLSSTAITDEAEHRPYSGSGAIAYKLKSNST